MTILTFSIEFHGPLRVGTGQPGRGGADEGLDPRDPLPATSLKGVLRATAVSLGAPNGLVEEVFGSEARAGTWWFSGAKDWQWRGPVDASGLPVPFTRSRIAIDDATGVARDGALLFAEEVWPAAASFEVEALVPLEASVLDRHRALLVLAAGGTHALGADRRRGLGWVSIRPSGAGEGDLRAAVDLVMGGPT